MRPNKFIVRILKFCLVAIPVYIGAIILLGEFSNKMFKKNMRFMIGNGGFMNSRLKDVATTKDIDILFLGSSHAHSGFDPRIFKKHGFKTFNLGSNAQTSLQTHFLLESNIRQLKPKLVIIEVYPVMYTTMGEESSIDIMSNGKVNMKLLKMVLQQRSPLTFNSLIFSFYKELIGVKNKFVEPKRKENDGDTYVKGGYLLKDITYATQEKFEKQTLFFKPLQFQYLQKCIDLIKESGAEYLLVQSPINTQQYR